MQNITTCTIVMKIINPQHFYSLLIKNKYIHIIRDMLILALANLGLASATWLHASRVGGGDWPTLGEGWFQGSEPFPPFWGSGQLFTGGSWSIGVDGAMFGWFSVSTTIAMYVQNITGIDAIGNWFFFLFTPIVLGMLLAYPYMYRILGTGISSIIACLCYSWSSHQIVGVNGGQWLVVGTASALPILLWSLIRIIETNRPNKYFLIFIISSCLIAILDPRFIFIAFFPSAIICVSTINKKTKKEISLRIIKIFTSTISVLFIAQAPWLMGMVLGGGTEAVPQDRLTVSNVYNLSFLKLDDAMNLRHTLWLPSLVWTTTEYQFLSYILNCYFIMIMIGVWANKKNKYIVFSGIIYILGIILSKGSNEPFSAIYPWIFTHIPGFIFFRDPVKWFIYVSLGAAPIVGCFAGMISQSIINLLSKITYLKLMVIFIIMFCVIIPVVPILANNDVRNGSFIGVVANSEVQKLNNMLTLNRNTFRSLIIPWGDHQIEHSENHQVITLYHLLGGKWGDFVPYGKTTMEQYSKLLASPFFKTLLMLANVQYLIVPDDREGVVFGRDLAGFGPDVPGFSDTVAMVETHTGFRRNTEYIHHGVFELPASEPLYAVQSLRAGTRDAIQKIGLDGSWPISDIDVGSAVEMLLAVPSDEPSTFQFGFSRESRVRYVADLVQVKPVWIVLSEPFADGWHAYGVPANEAETAFEASIRKYPRLKGAWWWARPGNTLLVERHALGQHIVVNGYMQAWRVPEPGSYRVIVEYLPQRAYEAGWIVTIAGVTCVALMAGIGTVRAIIRRSVR